MTKFLHENAQPRVARVYDILNCGPNNRFVANGKVVHNSGGDSINLQNLPRGGAIRRSIKAPPGHVLVACDSSQIEARVVAWLAGDSALVEAFTRGDDIYSMFASTVYGKPINKAEHKMERHVGKTAILGLGYGMGSDKFRTTLKSGNPSVEISDAEAKRIVSLYRIKYAQITKLWTRCGDALYSVYKSERRVFGVNNLLETCAEGIKLPNGMLIRYPHLTYEDKQFAYASDRRQVADWTTMQLSGNIELDKLTRIYGGKVCENLTQALARIVVFDQMLVIGAKYNVVLTVHDEVVVCVPEDQAEEARDFMAQAMSVAPAWAPGLPIACEAAIGRNYADAK